MAVPSVSSNQLTWLPGALGSLSRLTVLAARHNRLAGLPAQLAACSSLTVLDLRANCLHRLPLLVSTLPQLKACLGIHQKTKQDKKILFKLLKLYAVYWKNQTAW